VGKESWSTTSACARVPGIVRLLTLESAPKLPTPCLKINKFTVFFKYELKMLRRRSRET
jgi:hypothetical protein